MMLPEEKELVRLQAEQAEVNEQLRMANAAMEAIRTGRFVSIIDFAKPSADYMRNWMKSMRILLS